MGNEWETRRIGDLGRVVTGKTPSTAIPQNFGGEYPFITIPDMVGRREISTSARSLSEQGAQSLRTCRLPAGAVMMSCIATIGNCGITTRPSFTNQQINSLICGDNVDPRFVYYCFTQLGHALEAAGGGGSVYTNVSKSRFEQIEISVPPLPTQRAIAHVLGTLDDLIELNRETNEILEEMARALFKSWFVDFDPVRAKLEGRQPAGMDAATAAIFPDHFQDSELGQIPRGWSVGKFGDVCASSRQGVSPEQIDPETPYIGLEHMPRRSIALGEWETAAKVSSGKSAFNKGDILFGKLRPYFHKVGVAPVNGVCSTDILVLLPKKPDWFGFVLGHASSDALVQFADQSSAGTKMPRTNWKDMSSFQITIPPQNVASAFSQIVRSQVETIQESIFESRDLAALRDTLLPKLLSGEVSAPGAEELIAVST